MEVIPAEFARIVGVSRSSVSEKIKNKTLIINGAGMLDTDNPLNAAYISRHRQKQAELAAAPGPSQKVSPVKLFEPSVPMGDFQIAGLAGVPVDLLNLPIREIIRQYPGLEKIERYVKIHKDWTAAAEKELRINERNLTLIPKDFVISRLFSFVENLAKQILEYPESVAEKIIAIVQTGGGDTKNKVIQTIREGLGQILAGSKDQIIAELRNLKNKYQSENQSIDRIEEIKAAIEEAAIE